MPRIRSVHPGFFTDEAVVGCSMAARVLLIGLWTEADDGGVFSWKPITLKMRILPADTADVNALLAELEAANVIRRYEAEGGNWGAIRNFMVFQRPKSPKQTHPRLGWVPDFCGENRRKFRNGHLDSDDDFGGGGETETTEPSRFPKKGETVPPKSEKSMQMEDGIGGDKTPPFIPPSEPHEPESPPQPQKRLRAKKSKRPLPDDFELDESMRQFAIERVPRIDCDATFEHFKANALKNGNEYKDWVAAWRTWILSPYPKILHGQARDGPPGAVSITGSLRNTSRAADRRYCDFGLDDDDEQDERRTLPTLPLNPPSGWS